MTTLSRSTLLARSVVTGALATMVEIVAFWLTRDYPISLRYVATHVAWVMGIGAILGAVSAALKSERAVARLWLVLPPFLVLTPLLVRRLGAASVLVGAALAVGWSARRGAHRESAIAAGLAGAAIGVHLGHFLMWDYAGRETAAAPLVWLGVTSVSAVAAYVGWTRARPSALIDSPGRAIPALGIGLAAIVVAVTRSGEPLPSTVTAGGTAVDGPPVVLIVLDTVRADHLRLYGYQRDTMPSLTAFATREAVLVERAISNGPDSLAGHASLFTGLFPVNHGAHRPVRSDRSPPPFGYPLRSDVATLAEVLRDHGFTTLGVSANYGPVGGDSGFGLERGFDLYRSFPDGECDFGPASPWKPLARQLGRFGADWLASCQVPYRRADVITDEAIGLIDATADRGFFLFVNYLDAHRPYDPPPAFRESFPGVDATLGRDAMERAEVARLLEGTAPLPGELAAHFAALYDGELRFLDAHLSRLLDRLRRHPSWDDMLLIITSDHGEALGEHMFIGHSALLYDVIIRVPLLIKAGRGDSGLMVPPPGQRWDRPMQLVDVAPLVWSHAGAPVSPGIDGRLPSVEPGPLRAWAFPSPPLKALSDRFDRELRSIEVDGWKLIEDSRGVVELYHTRVDPKEETDLASLEPERARDLQAQLGPRRTYRDTSHPAGETPDESLERLRSLGYIR